MIPEAIWTLLCPGANGRCTGERFYQLSYVATMRRAAAKNNLALNLFVLKITHGSAFALGTAHTSFVLGSPLDSLSLTVSLLGIGDHHEGWGR
jgi:hypothetical protein